jgi:hypothetical protein
VTRALATLVALAGLVVVPFATAAKAPVCQNIPLPDRLEETPIAFVGKLISSSPRAGATYWRFEVDQRVKGPIGKEVDIRAPLLTDAKGRPLDPVNEVGVLATLDGATIVTNSCLLTDPAALLAVADKDRGGPIKLFLGLLTLAIVLGVCWFRIRRGSRPSFPGMPNDPGARAREARGR